MTIETTEIKQCAAGCGKKPQVAFIDPEGDLHHFCYEHGKQAQDVFHWLEWDNFEVVLI